MSRESLSPGVVDHVVDPHVQVPIVSNNGEGKPLSIRRDARVIEVSFLFA